MHEHDRRSGADRLDVKVQPVRRGDFAHCGNFDDAIARNVVAQR
jgi:hypothetical protein